MVSAKEIYQSILGLEPKKYRNSEVAGSEIPNDETTIFTFGNKELTFIAARHVMGLNPFVNFLESVLSRSMPQIILLEMDYNVRQSYISNLLSRPKDSWTEIEWAVEFAKKRGIKVRGMDDQESIGRLDGIDKGDRDKFLIFQQLVNSINWKINTGAYRFTNFEDVYRISISEMVSRIVNQGKPVSKSAFLEIYNSSAGDKEGGVLSFVEHLADEMCKKYISSEPARTILSREYPFTPYPWSKKYRTNTIAAQWNSYRDKKMIETCISSLRRYDKVVALAGSGHIMEAREVLSKELRKEFGKVEVKRWKEIA